MVDTRDGRIGELTWVLGARRRRGVLLQRRLSAGVSYWWGEVEEARWFGQLEGAQEGKLGGHELAALSDLAVGGGEGD